MMDDEGSNHEGYGYDSAMGGCNRPVGRVECSARFTTPAVSCCAGRIAGVVDLQNQPESRSFRRRGVQYSFGLRIGGTAAAGWRWRRDHGMEMQAAERRVAGQLSQAGPYQWSFLGVRQPTHLGSVLTAPFPDRGLARWSGLADSGR